MRKLRHRTVAIPALRVTEMAIFFMDISPYL
jgi:hypothetical protein